MIPPRSKEEIYAAIPHREPFLLVDQVLQCDGDHIVCRKTFRGDEWWYQGHYPRYPITPGVLLCEAAMQAGAILLARCLPRDPDKVPVVTRMNDVRFKSMVRPGDTVLLEVHLDEHTGGAYFLSAKVIAGDRLAVQFQFACKMIAPQGSTRDQSVS
jgi:3-hydroxyacyl-[acyl-carrier-protein] dehydratase